MGARVQNMCSGSSTHSSPSAFSTFWKSNLDANDDEAHVNVAEDGLLEDGAEDAARLRLLVRPGGPAGSPSAGREALKLSEGSQLWEPRERKKQVEVTSGS